MNDEIKPQRKIIKFLVITLVVIFIVFFYARNIATTIISIKEYPIKNNNLPQNFNGLKIVQFSDIEYNSTTNLRTIKKVVKKINYLEPDIVIYTGDLINSSSNLSKEDITSIAKELNKIDVSINKYAIIGDDDYSDVNTYLKIMNDANFKVLDNQNELIEEESDSEQITPFDDNK